ncbi:hypothetical protein DXG01_006850 [Tephrocybe rancida]|nr:hypothetical protein DXG01_006850 [Tephrocybe rancida]
MEDKNNITCIFAVSQVAGSYDQIPLLPQEIKATYSFKWPIKKVAIIGAGPGGLVNYREFVKAGFDVRLFERDSLPGGNWRYTDETPLDAPIPNADISVADFVPSLPPKGVTLPYEEVYHGEVSDVLRRAHRAPKPIWDSLHSNAAAIPELPWPKGTAWELPHAKIGRYVRAFASFHGVNSNDANTRVSYNTRVELVEKRYNEYGEEAGWTLTLKQVIATGKESSKAIWSREDFDAVVVASGRYNAPNIPNIAGLAAWAERFPGQLTHSRQYRRPQTYANKTVLIVGAATSGGEISRDLNQHVQKIYQSVRLDLFLRRLPTNVTVVPEIKRFLPPASRIEDSRVELANGTVISGIDTVLFATGYRYTFPFLPQFHNSSVKHTDDEPNVYPHPIVTDGTHLRALYLDAFSIDDPTLGFIDMNVGMQSFTYSEYLAVALTKLWSNQASIPDTAELWRLQRVRVQQLGGYGPHFQFLGAEKTDGEDHVIYNLIIKPSSEPVFAVLIRFFLGWLNDAASKYGGRTINGIDAANGPISKIWNQARFGNDVLSEERPVNTTFSTSDVDGPLSRASVEDLIALYNDSW